MNERLRSGGLYIILPAIELDLRGVERAFQWQFSTMMNKTIRSTQFERRQDAKIRTLLAPQPLWDFLKTNCMCDNTLERFTAIGVDHALE